MLMKVIEGIHYVNFDKLPSLLIECHSIPIRPRGFELETFDMEVPSPNHWATPKGRISLLIVCIFNNCITYSELVNTVAPPVRIGHLLEVRVPASFQQ
uniref:Putative ovule protein n=1 Tax=Solanum chacoense TaxID=4108 RepID=A0A0V0H9C2_SOLCH